MRPRVRDRLLSWYFNFGFSPAHIAATARRLLNQQGRRIPTDSGEQLARIVVDTARGGPTRER